MRLSDNQLISLFTERFGTDRVCAFDQLDQTLRQRVVQSLAPDSLQPSSMLCPETIAELSEFVTLAHEYRLRMMPCGNATKLDWGGLVSRADVVISTAKLNQVIEHCVGDLTVTVEAGTKYQDLQEILAKQGQFLAIDPPYGAKATMGGVLATGSAGSWRHRYNSVRDMCLGIEFVRADGEVVKAGGRVVKNVAGYDLMKLLTGSYGTLGLVSKVTFRLYPLPEFTQIIVIAGQAQAIASAQQEICTSVMTPMVCDLLSASAIDALGLGQGMGLVLQFSGLKLSVLEQCDRMALIAKKLNLEVQILDEAQEFWELLEILLWQDELRDSLQPMESKSVVCKFGILPSASVSFLKECEQIFAQRPFYLQIHAGSGLGVLRVEDVQNLDAIALQIAKIRSIAEASQGFLSILEAPQALKFANRTVGGANNLESVWGYRGNARDLMVKIQQQFDPRGLLSCDRL
ncbi:MAG: FAD-binding oxidoreductase [Pseudanabaena sp.]|nr:MAG: FAD-binding oxidoreductase [Pseudanabaena sp.]